MVRRIEIAEEAVKVVYRIDNFPFVPAPEGGVLQHCWRNYHVLLSKEAMNYLAASCEVSKQSAYHFYAASRGE